MEQRSIDRIRQEFPEPDAATAIASLERYAGPETARVQWDILELSRGDLESLGQYVGIAQTDYRDVLYWAEYYKDDPLMKGRDPKQLVTEILAKLNARKPSPNL